MDISGVAESISMLEKSSDMADLKVRTFFGLVEQDVIACVGYSIRYR